MGDLLFLISAAIYRPKRLHSDILVTFGSKFCDNSTTKSIGYNSSRAIMQATGMYCYVKT